MKLLNHSNTTSEIREPSGDDTRETTQGKHDRQATTQ